VIMPLATTAGAVQRRGAQLVLLIPPEQRQVARIAQMIQLAEIFAIPRHAQRCSRKLPSRPFGGWVSEPGGSASRATWASGSATAGNRSDHLRP
jgi:hypothetical protein